MKVILARTTIVLFAVLILPMLVIMTTFRELRNALHYVWLDFLVELDEVRRAWQRGSLK